MLAKTVADENRFYVLLIATVILINFNIHLTVL